MAEPKEIGTVWTLGCDVFIEDALTADAQEIKVNDIVLSANIFTEGLSVEVGSDRVNAMDLDVRISMDGLKTYIIDSQIVPYEEVLKITDFSPEATNEKRYASSANTSKKIIDSVSELEGRVNVAEGDIDALGKRVDDLELKGTGGSGDGFWYLNEQDGKIHTDIGIVVHGNAIIEGDTSSGGEGQDTPAAGLDEQAILDLLEREKYVTEDDIEGLIPDVDLSEYAKTEDVETAISEVGEEIGSLSTLLSSMWHLDENGNLVTDKQVLIKNNLIIEGDTSSGGEGEDTPGGSGGVSEEDVLDILEKNNYITSAALSSYYTKGESDARYLASSLLGSNTLIHSGNIGSYAIKTDGSNEITGDNGLRWADNMDFDTLRMGLRTFMSYNGTSVEGVFPSTNYGTVLHVGINVQNYAFQLGSSVNADGLFYRGYYASGQKWNDWKTIAFTDSNVASATKLQTARTIWGQSFDGTGDVLAGSGVGLMSSKGYYYGLSILPMGSPYWGVRTFLTYDQGSTMGAYEIASRNAYGLTISHSGGVAYDFGNIPSDLSYDVLVNIRPDGNVGIGTDSPSYKLDVAGSIAASESLHIKSNDATADIYPIQGLYEKEAIAIQTAFDKQDPQTSSYPSSYPTRVVLALQPRGGYVGIGTTSPLSKLQVDGQINLSNGTNNNYAFISQDNYSSNTSWLKLGTCYGYNTESVAMTLYSGMVKIGNAIPSYKLDVDGTGSFYGVRYEPRTFVPSTTGWYRVYKSLIYSRGDNVRLNISRNYNNTPSGSYTFDVVVGYQTASITQINSATHTSYRYLSNVRVIFDGNYAYIDVYISGNSNSWYVSGSGRGEFQSGVINTETANVFATLSPVENSMVVGGNLIVSGDTSSGSDIRFKDVIKNKTLKIEHIAKAPLFTFKWNDRVDDTIHLGSSAQYWEKVTPWLVKGEDFKTLDYSTLGVAMGISLAKKAVNHEERIKVLEKEIKRLKEEMIHG